MSKVERVKGIVERIDLLLDINRTKFIELIPVLLALICSRTQHAFSFWRLGY